MPKTLPDRVTQLDILKTVAVIFMIIDHIGFYFFPGEDWWRVIGRLGAAPFWFFLIGYANTREIPNKLMIGATVLVVADMFLFQSFFSLNILVGIILLRLTIDRVVNFVVTSRYIFVLATILFAFTAIGSKEIIEYGTMAWLFGMLGFFVRHKEEVMAKTFMTKYDFYGYAAFTVVFYCLIQNAIFGFTEVQFIVELILTAGIIVVLMNMDDVTFPQIEDKSLKRFLQFCGRNTLEIYVAHLLLFKIAIFVFLALK